MTIATGRAYELDELHDYLGDLRKYARLAPETAGVGRNIEAFDAVRQLAYRAAREFWGPDGLEPWELYLREQVRAYTRERTRPAPA